MDAPDGCSGAVANAPEARNEKAPPMVGPLVEFARNSKKKAGCEVALVRQANARHLTSLYSDISGGSVKLNSRLVSALLAVGFQLVAGCK